MEIRRIMKTDVGSDRHGASIPGSLRIKDLDHRSIKSRQEYDVLDSDGRKIGEIEGSLLNYLIKNERKLQLSDIGNSLDDGLMVVDERGVVCYVNEAYTKLIEVDAKDFVGKNLKAFEEDHLALVAIETGESIIVKNRFFPVTGKKVNMQFHPIYVDGSIRGAFTLLHDVTDLFNLSVEIHNSYARDMEHTAEVDFGGEEGEKVIWRSEDFWKVLERISLIAPAFTPVLIKGEPGTGKTLAARLIHKNSTRSDGPFITVTCSAVSEKIMYDGAMGQEELSGKMEMAKGGTLVLDEIGHLPYDAQGRLLDLLEKYEAMEGDDKEEKGVRLIATSTYNLEGDSEKGRIRKELYYRLNVLSLTIPPLRERREDIVPLGNYFLEKLNKKYGKKIALSTETFTRLERYDWLGNVRQLKNLIEDMVITTPGGIVDEVFLPDGKGLEDTVHEHRGVQADESGIFSLEGRDFNRAVEDYEKQLIISALRECGGDREKAVKRLGISRRTFYRKLEGVNKKAIL